LAERLCKRAVEQLFGREFTEKRFADLRGIGGKLLQIDLYCDELKLAIEHHGSQHFSPKKFWGQWRFKRQQEHDRRRREYCQQRGIALIELRQVGEVTKLKDLKAIIRRECEKANVAIPAGYDETQIDFHLHTLKPKQQMMLERLERLVAELGWQKRTPGYLGVLVKHDFICDKGHPVPKTPSSLFGGEGCDECEKRPVMVEKIGVFSSVSEAATNLGRSISATHRAAVSQGASAGHRVRFLSWEEYKQLSNCAKAQADYWNRIPAKPVRPRKSSFGVLLSDGRLFQTGADASRELGVAPETLYNAIRRGGTCHGLCLRKLTVTELASALADKAQLSQLLSAIPKRIPHAKPNRRLVLTSLGEVFESILAASRALRVHTSSIHDALNGRHRCQGRLLLAVPPSMELSLKNNPAGVIELFAETQLGTKR
jgi:very-short-patch-repair endonuclease